MDIKTTIENIDNAKVKLNIDIPVDHVNSEFTNSYKSFGSKVNVPGFRKGKVPNTILKTRFGEHIKNEVFESIVSKAINSVCKKENLDAIMSTSKIEDINSVYSSLEEGKDLSFTATLEVYPSVEISQYTNLKIDAIKYLFNETDVLNKLKEFQDKVAEIKNKTENEPIEKNDIIQFQYQFYLIGKNENNYDTGRWELGKHDKWFEQIKDQIIGMKLGEEKETSVLIPKDHPNENLKSKQGYISIKITNIENKILPPIDDELAKDFGFSTLEEAKENIRNFLQNTCDKQTRQLVHDKIIEQLSETSKFNIGEQIIEFQIDEHISRLEEQLKPANITLEDYLKNTNKPIKDFRDELRETINKEIKASLINNEIIKANNITITDDEVKKELEKYEKQYQVSLGEGYETTLKEEYKVQLEKAKKKLSQRNELNAIKDIKIYDKLIDYLIDNNEVSYTEEPYTS